jgi:lysozyme
LRSLPTAGPSLHISARGLHLIEGFEGFSSCPYRDSVGTGHPYTRGYGETEGIHPGSPCISRTQGEANLRRLVEARYEWALRALGVSLNQNEWDADCSFVWNLGAGIFQGTTIGAEMRARNFRAAAASMLQYDHAGGIVLAGLRTRREAEVRLFLTPVSKPSPAELRRQRKRELKHDYRYRAHLRRVLLQQGCRVARPSRHCRGVLRSGADVNRRIRRIHSEFHIY